MSSKQRPPSDDEALHGLPPIGPELRAKREEHGIDILQAAAILRIKPAYLSALEDGRYRDLPGAAYAIGFVRTYGDYLGFNGADVVQRFKHEAAGGLNQRTTLAFPSPAPRGRVPGTLPLLIALIVAAAIAGAWYMWRDEAQAWFGQVPDVPDRLMASVTPPPTPPALPAPRPAVVAETPPAAPALPPAPAIIVPPVAAASPPPAAPTAPPPAASPPVTAAAPAAPVQAAPPVTAPVPLPVPTIGQSITLPPPPVTAALQPPPTPPQPVAEPIRRLAPIPPPPPPQPTEPEAAEDETPPAPSETAAATPTAPATDTTAALQPPPANPPAEGRIFGAVNDTVRVVIKSKGDSWIQVRDADNQPVMTRVLRAGDTYRVPNRPGLVLMTGNAGVLDVSVDGQAAPALGPVGMVRRAVPLDPDKLKAGTIE